MKVSVRWFLTGKVSIIEDRDDILNPDSTIAELKGLMQIRFGFPAKEILIIHEHLLENKTTFRSLGILGQSTDPILRAHVIRETELESSNLDVDDTSKDDNLQEYSHADFILAMKMLGKPVPITDERLVAMRKSAPRQRPAFLNAPSQHTPPPRAGGEVPTAMPGTGGDVLVYDPKNTEVHQIFASIRYGMRKEGVDTEFAINYPGVEPFPFWDMRTPDAIAHRGYPCHPGEVCLELFYFGEFSAIKDKTRFLALAKHSLESKAGVRVTTPGAVREAGCMYPLVAVLIVLHEVDAMALGNRIFEDFGKSSGGLMKSRTSADAGVAGNGGCGAQ